jgi:membrane protein
VTRTTRTPAVTHSDGRPEATTAPSPQPEPDTNNTATKPRRRDAGRIDRRIGRAVDALYRWLETNPVTRLPWSVIQTFSNAEGALLSGSMAYFTFLSILPLLMVTGFVLGSVTVGSADLQELLAEGISGLLPGVQGSALIDQLIHARATFGIVGLVTVAYAGSGFVGALTACLNRMWGLEQGRNPIGQKLLNLGVVILLGIVLLGSVGLTVWVEFVADELFERQAGPLVALLERLASPVALFLILLLLYRLLPARRLGWRAQLPGAAFAAVAVELLKRGFALWAERSAGVAVLPRSLLSVVLLLVWFGFFGQAILYGAALNVTLERRAERLGRPWWRPWRRPRPGSRPAGTKGA